MPNKTIEVAAAEAAGALGGARQRNPPICEKIRQTIEDMRSDVYLAVAVEQFVKFINESLSIEAEERGVEAVEVTADDVKACIKGDDTIRIIEKGGKEVLWLWGGAYMRVLVDRVIEWAVEYGEVTAYGESE
jgi:hypothetical protein